MTRTGRRFVVALSLAALVGLVPALPAVGTPPSADVRSVRLDRWTAAAAPPGARSASSLDWSVSPELPADDVVAVGADWGGDPDVTVEVRARRAGGWGDWIPLPLVSDHAPDPGTPEAERGATDSSDPVWVGPSEALQVRQRGAGRARSMDLHTVTVSGGDGLGFQPRVRGAAANAATIEPRIISRRAWGADESINRAPPDYAEDVRFSVVHHTAGTNDYSCAESDDIVRAIHEYHVEVRGWNDIAYNFLVDRCGQVFEGRAGGVTEAVIGAHAAGWNGGSTGVSALGNFNLTPPSSAMIDALDQLLAWKLDLHHVDPFGTTEELAGGGATNRFERDDRLVLPTIIGHRVTNETSCPGDNLVRHIVEEHAEHPRDEPAARWEPVAAHRVEPIGVPKGYGGPPVEREQPLTGERPRWDVTFTEPLDWRLTVRDEHGQLVRSTGGVAASGVDLSWDLRDAHGDPVAPGSYATELTAWSARGSITPITTRIEVTRAADRVWGEHRVATALELSRWAFDSASRVVLATSTTYADALAATPLAGSFGGPVLLTQPDRLSDGVAEEIARLQADEVWLIGGEKALHPRIVTDVIAQTAVGADDVHRLAGADRYETAYEVADLVLHREGATEVLVAVGRHAEERRAFPDALAAGAFGAQFDLPIVLVEAETLPPSTRHFLEEHDLSDGVQVFGGYAAIGFEVEREMFAATGVQIRRFAGADRYDTSRLAAEEVLRRWAEREDEIGGPSPHLEGVGVEIALASGETWPDALGAGAAADERPRTLFLLTPPEHIDPDGPTARFISERAADITHAVIAGGTVAIDEPVRVQLDGFVRLDGPHTAPSEGWPDDPHAEVPLPLPGPTASASPSPSPSPVPPPFWGG